MSAQGIKQLVKYMMEREAIRLRREEGKKFPWTRDKILQKYRFTNVRRVHDRTTRAFATIYNEYSEAGPAVMLMNAAIFRLHGTIAFAQAMGWSRDTKNLTTRLARAARSVQEGGERVFTSAYVITNGGEAIPKLQYVDSCLRDLSANAEAIIGAFHRQMSWQQALERLQDVKGFGGSGFMAKEVLQDCLLHPSWAGAEDARTWTPLGPGGLRGLNRVYERELNFCGNRAERIMDCIVLHAKITSMLPQFKDLTAHDIQFNLCEFDKYERARTGDGEPKRLYTPSI